MSAAIAQQRVHEPVELDEDENEHRLHRRFVVPLAGRFMRPNKQEFACKVKDVSVGGASLTLPHAVPTDLNPGEKIIAYIGPLGGLEGTVIRVWHDGFAFKYSATAHKREKLAAQLTFLMNEKDMTGAAARRHERLRIAHRDATLTLREGGFMPCLILDVSLSGASIACKIRPDVGEEVWLSRLRGRVVRHHAEGIGIQFMEVLNAQDMQAHFG